MEFHVEQGMIDSHLHILEMAKKDMDVPEILSQLEQIGVELLLDASVDLKDFENRLNYRQYHKGLLFAAGIHPNIPSYKWIDSYKDILHNQASRNDVAAIGETGLDFFRNTSSPEDQYHLLDLHYSVALTVKKPLIFHCRNAEKELMRWMQDREFPNGAVLHCFPGDEILGKTAIEKGFMISLAGNSTFKNAQNIRDSLNWIPRDKILVETDAPYLSPVPLRGRLNHTGHIGYIYEMIASEWNIPLREIIELINHNFRNFLSI